jgi:3-dehydroquinate dehydratase
MMNTDELRAFIDSKFRLPVVEGEDKICALDEAIRAHVKKEMSIGADVCKIIMTAEKIEDNLTCIEFVCKVSKVKDTVCFCMGKLGTTSRFYLPYSEAFTLTLLSRLEGSRHLAN